jgi:drug/metabolite transporter (DMT)-like permease
MTEPEGRTFAAREWLILVAVASMWGSSFLLIKLGLGRLEPAVVAWLRLVFGAATLGCFPAARRQVRREDLGGIALLGLVWMAVPFLLLPLAEESIPSSLAGMVNASAPLFTAGIAAAWMRQVPSRQQLLGLVLGFAGVAAISWPSTGSVAGTLPGAGLVLGAAFLYGVAFNMAEPLERHSGALAVIWRAEMVAALALTPFGLVGLASSDPDPASIGAMVVLGALSTGLAFAGFIVLVGRVGATRASVAVYLVPVVAILLGVAVRHEPVAVTAYVGTALILLGAYLTSRPPRRG